MLRAAVDEGQRAQLGLLSGSLPELGQDISPLALDVAPVSAAVLRARIGAPGRWEVPQALFANRDAPGAGLPLSCALQGCCTPVCRVAGRVQVGRLLPVTTRCL